MTTVRTLIYVAVVRHWPLYQMDVKNAFLNGHLTEEAAVTKLGFHPSAFDSALFLRHTLTGFVALLLYVDDMITTGFDSSAISEVKQHLFHTFKIKDVGLLWYFLSIEVVFSPKGFLSQAKYANEVIHCAGLADIKVSNALIKLNVKLNSTDGIPLDDPTFYCELVGCLVYLTVTCPNLAYAVHVVSKFISTHRSIHWAALVCILRYLRGTIFLGLLLSSTFSLDLVAYVDSDWAGDVNDRKSTSSFYMFLGDSLIS
ncbi:uncharacterized protein LOC114317923 [Camellia sinensis]|uniref:uncharacterized protein LOC114317923 n=1 Tax=Camellia sinensis TaxID=4442 RepID=UPI001036A8D0|nr:uncharacterized protein LOC114317923 [Camellia sinensis]